MSCTRFDRLAVVFVLLVVLGCSDGSSSNKESDISTDTSSRAQMDTGTSSCTSGTSQCDQNRVYHCDGGEWVLWDDCESQGLFCLRKQGEDVCVERSANDTASSSLDSENEDNSINSDTGADNSLSRDSGSDSPSSSDTGMDNPADTNDPVDSTIESDSGEDSATNDGNEDSRGIGDATDSLQSTDTYAGSEVEGENSTTPDVVDTASCDFAPMGISTKKVNMLIVLDRSLSMSEDGFWNPLGQAITDATAAMESVVNFGLMTFPFTDEDCSPGDVLVDIAANNAEAIGQRVGGGARDVGTALGTPMSTSLVVAKEYLDTIDNSLDTYVLLAADGAPNCNPELDSTTCVCSVNMNGSGCLEPQWCLDDQSTYFAAAALKEAGYPVFVLGIGDSMQWGDVMDTIATVGGTGSYISADSDQFVDVFMAIIGATTSCEFNVDWLMYDDVDERDPDSVSLFCKQSSDVSVEGGIRVPYSENCASPEGWTWADTSYATVRLCQDTCDAFKRDYCPELTIGLGCAGGGSEAD